MADRSSDENANPVRLGAVKMDGLRFLNDVWQFGSMGVEVMPGKLTRSGRDRIEFDARCIFSSVAA